MEDVAQSRVEEINSIVTLLLYIFNGDETLDVKMAYRALDPPGDMH